MTAKYKEASSVIADLQPEHESLQASYSETDASNKELKEKVTELMQSLQSSDSQCQV
jgi:hypothetical protein